MLIALVLNYELILTIFVEYRLNVGFFLKKHTSNAFLRIKPNEIHKFYADFQSAKFCITYHGR